MQPTMTTADWLRRAADAWSEADATQDQEARRPKILVAEGCERLAKHAAFLAQDDAYPPVALDDCPDGPCTGGSLKPRLPESLLRGLVALLATPFLLLIMVAVVSWLKVSGKLPVYRQMMFASVWATSLTWPQLMGPA